MGHLGGHEEHGAGVLAGGHAGPAANALSGVHRQIGILLRHRDAVSIGRAAGANSDESTGLLDAVERLPVTHQILNDGEGLGAPGLDDNLVAIAEAAHVGLAGGHALVRTVGLAIDDQRAGATNALAAIVVEGDGIFAPVRELFVHHVEHLQERHFRIQLGRRIGLELARGIRVLLAPDFQANFHWQ